VSRVPSAFQLGAVVGVSASAANSVIHFHCLKLEDSKSIAMAHGTCVAIADHQFQLSPLQEP
jgi:hypothetical protein